MVQTIFKSKGYRFSYVEKKNRKSLQRQLVFSEEFHKRVKKWKTCITSSDDRAYKFQCVCFKTQSHFFRDLNWPSYRPALASKVCFIWPTWWFYLKIESGFKNQKISSACLDFWYSLENLKIWLNCSHSPRDSPLLEQSTCRLIYKGNTQACAPDCHY